MTALSKASKTLGHATDSNVADKGYAFTGCTFNRAVLLQQLSEVL
jgi:hypothetical protein